MRLALDARSLQERPLAGVGRATGRMLPYLSERVDIELLTQTERPSVEMGLPEHALSTPWPHVGSAWLQWSAARWLKNFDGIFHCPWYALPLIQHVPMVVTIHDLTFERHPEWFGRARRWSYASQARWAARTGRAIVTVSQFVADDIMTTYGVTADRLFVSRPCVDEIFAPGLDADDVLERLGCRQPYLVAIGGNPRRNLDVAVAAWRAVAKPRGLGLIVVGTEDIPHEPGVTGGRLSDPEWAAVLSNAAALVYPTSYEGFGMPAIEAIASGTPVICAPVGSLPEVLGDAAVWCEAPSAEAIASGVRRLLDSAPLQDELRETGIFRARSHPTWRDSADIYYEAYTLATQ